MAPTPEKLIKALQEVLDLIGKFIERLEYWAGVLYYVEAGTKTGKIVGTSLFGLGSGAALLAAPILAPLALVAVGASTYGVADIVDTIEAKICADEVEKLFKILNQKFAELNAMIVEFKDHFELSMKTLDIDRDASILLTMADSPFTVFLRNAYKDDGNFLVAAGLICNLLHSEGPKISVRLAKEGSSVKIPYIFTYLGIAKSELVKLGPKIAAGATATLKNFAFAGVGIAIYKLIELLRNVSADNQGLTIIKNAMKDLKANKSAVDEILRDVKELRRNATTIINEVRINELNRELGGGYTEDEGLMSFKRFVEQIGTGNYGSFYEIFYLAQMTGRSIQISDGTNSRELLSLHGKQEITIPAVLDYRETWTESLWSFFGSTRPPIRLLLTSENGVRHYSPIDENGKVLNTVNHSQYHNRCLFDAVAFHTDTSSDILIQKLREYLLNSKVAKLDYDFQLAEYFPEFLGGATKKPDKNNQTKVTKEKESRTDDPNVTAQTYSAVITFANLANGSPVTSKIRKKMKEMIAAFNLKRKKHVTFDSGHIIARILGGPGDTEDNVVPMTTHLNRSLYKRLEHAIRVALTAANGNLSARMNVIVRRRNNSPIPFEFVVGVKFYDKKGNLQNEKTMSARFLQDIPEENNSSCSIL